MGVSLEEAFPSFSHVSLHRQRATPVTWDCTYHVVIVPMYRKKVLFSHVRKRAGEIIRQLARQKDMEVIEGTARLEHLHLILSIPPRHSVAGIMGFLKGKSA